MDMKRQSISKQNAQRSKNSVTNNPDRLTIHPTVSNCSQSTPLTLTYSDTAISENVRTFQQKNPKDLPIEDQYNILCKSLDNNLTIDKSPKDEYNESVRRESDGNSRHESTCKKPNEMYKSYHIHKPWWNQEAIDLVRKRRAQEKYLLKNPNIEALEEYKAIEKMCKKKLRQLKRDYLQKNKLSTEDNH